MSQAENILSFVAKKPAVTLTVALLSGIGLGVLFEKNKDKLILKKKYENFGELPQSMEVSKEELGDIMKQHTKLLVERQCLEAMVPREFNNEETLKTLSSNLEYAPNQNDLQGLTKALSEPIWDLLDRGGKRWRPILAIFIAKAFGRSIDEIIEAASLVEIVHNGSLLIDDIEDQSQVRRDKPCVHLLYGVDIAVNAGCFMYYAPMLGLLKVCEKKFPKEKTLRILKIYSEEMVNIHLGQAWDICWHNAKGDAKIPNEAQYLQMTAHKTGVLARMSARLSCEILDLPEIIQTRFAKFCEKIGVAFQIQDDILNLVGEEYVATKGYHGEDIFEGKMTLMVIHSLNNSPEEKKARLFDILKMKTKDPELINEAITILKESDSINYATAKAELLIKEAWDGIKDNIPNNKDKGCLKALAEYFINRKV